MIEFRLAEGGDVFVNSLQVEAVQAGKGISSAEDVSEVIMTSGAKYLVVGGSKWVAEKIRDSITFHMTHVSQG